MILAHNPHKFTYNIRDYIQCHLFSLFTSLPSSTLSFGYANRTNHWGLWQVIGVKVVAITFATLSICGGSNTKLWGDWSWHMIMFTQHKTLRYLKLYPYVIQHKSHIKWHAKTHLLIRECFATFQSCLSLSTRDVVWDTFPHANRKAFAQNEDKISLDMVEFPSRLQGDDRFFYVHD